MKRENVLVSSCAAALLLSIALVGCGGNSGSSNLASSLQESQRSKAHANLQAGNDKAASHLRAAAQTFEHVMETQHGKSALTITESKTIDFSKADCEHLTEAQLERYVDPRITGRTRELALRDMREQPICERHNVSFDPGGSGQGAYSNTWEDLQSIRNAVDTPLGNGLVRRHDGSVFVPAPSDFRPSAEPASPNATAGPTAYPSDYPSLTPAPGTGPFRKITSPKGYSGVWAAIEVPYCAWMSI
jgi:hypothetical protein